MKALKRLGALGVVMIVAIASSLTLGATPASAAGLVHYENVGNPGWCLDGNETGAYLHACGHGEIDFQLWEPSRDAGDLQLRHPATARCLRLMSDNFTVALDDCANYSGTYWYAAGRNGWVKFVSSTFKCLQPYGTWQAGRSWYPLTVDWCDPNNHDANAYDVNGNVPNILAWRWFF